MRCEGRIWQERHFVQCSCEAKVNRDGKDYCGTHDPVRRKEKEAARNAKWDAEWEASKVRAAANNVARKRAELCVEACFGISDETLLKFTQISRERRKEIRDKRASEIV